MEESIGLTKEGAEKIAKTFLSPKHGDIEDWQLLLLDYTRQMTEQNKAIIALLQDISDMVNDLLPLPK